MLWDEYSEDLKLVRISTELGLFAFNLTPGIPLSILRDPTLYNLDFKLELPNLVCRRYDFST